MAEQDLALMAHLMRRAGFSASYEELERRTAKGYEATVEELLNPESQPDLEMDILERRFIDWKDMNALEVNQAYWTYRMINTRAPPPGKGRPFLARHPLHRQLQVRPWPPDAAPIANVPRKGHGQVRRDFSVTWPATPPWSSTSTTA